MARARNIKPSFFANDELADLPAMARLLFIGLWTISDREGRTEDRPRRIKAEVLPYDECNVDELLDMLNKSGFIIRYASGDSKFIQVTNFAKHQNPHVKESPSEIPAPNEHHASTVQERCEEQPKPEQAGLIPDSPLLIPDTPSQKGESRKRSTTADKPASVSDATWHDFLTLRKTKKAPVTDTVMAAMQREADKAGVTLEIALQTCCETGWQGFNAGWYANRQASQPRGAAPAETAYQRSQRLRVAEACPDLARPAPDASDFFRTAKPMGNVVEVQAREVERITR